MDMYRQLLTSLAFLLYIPNLQIDSYFIQYICGKAPTCSNSSCQIAQQNNSTGNSRVNRFIHYFALSCSNPFPQTHTVITVQHACERKGTNQPARRPSGSSTNRQKERKLCDSCTESTKSSSSEHRKLVSVRFNILLSTKDKMRKPPIIGTVYSPQQRSCAEEGA